MNTDPKTRVLQAGAERLARDALLFDTFDDVSQATSAWGTSADEIPLSLPFGLELDELAQVLEAVAPVPEPPADISPIRIRAPRGTTPTACRALAG